MTVSNSPIVSETVTSTTVDTQVVTPTSEKATPVTAEDTLILKVIANVRDNKYSIVESESGYKLNDNVSVVLNKVNDRTSKTLVVGQQEFTGRYVRRLVKSIETKLLGETSTRGAKKKAGVTDSEAERLLAMI